MKRVKTSLRAGAAFVAAPAVLVLAVGPALAADGGGVGGVVVTNQETVQAHLDALGHVQDARVYEQLALQGHGRVTISDPVSTKNLRNLDGFGGFDVKGGNLVADLSVDGERRLRTVSDFTKALPLKVSATYRLNGRQVQPGDVVGQSGTLEVHYVVENITGRDQDVSFDDGTGAKVTRTEKVVIPMVGSLTTVLPSSFTDVRSAEAAIAGDGHGGTKMTYTMTLFGPIGSPRAEFGYAAKVTDGVVPAATISALPVSPLDSPSFKGGAASYKGGADTGLQLTSGATEIDSNVLKLRDGAAQLLAGLIKLRDGATQLNAGLAGQAAPGAAKLATGAGQLKSGADQLASGASKLKAGTGQLAKGAHDAKAGADQLAAGAGQLKSGLGAAVGKAPALVDGLGQVQDGLSQLDGGLVQMYGGIGQLPTKAQPLHDGISQLLAGIGNRTTTGTLVNGLEQVRSGLSGGAIPGLNQIRLGLYNPDPSAPGAYQKLGCAAVVLTDLVSGTLTGSSPRVGTPDACYASSGGIVPPLAGLSDGVNNYSRSVATSVRDQISGSLGQIIAGTDTPDTINQRTLVGGVNAVKAGLGTAVGGLGELECGLDNTTLSGVCDSTKPGLMQGLGAVDAGISTLVNGVVSQVQGGVGAASDTPANHTLRGGVNGLTDGVGQIQEGGKTLLDGLGKLNGGAGQLSGGLDDLSSGLGQLQSGAGQVDSGAGQLSTGAGRLDSGAGQLKSGADQLSSGLGDAATGSGQLAAGLTQAADKAPALRDGAGQLSAQGTSKLVGSGKATAADYGLKYALIEAGAERAKSEGMAYGAPANATGATAYSLELAGMTGEGDRNVGRGVGALAVFGLGAGLTVLRRRWL